LHADPGAERIARDPARLGVGIHGLQPVEGGGGVRELAHAVIEAALAAADTAGVEAQDRKAAIHEHVEQREHHLVVHRPAVLRVGMKDQRNRRVFFLALVITTLEATLRAGEHHIRHGDFLNLRFLLLNLILDPCARVYYVPVQELVFPGHPVEGSGISLVTP
jgi:hypothetical protein